MLRVNNLVGFGMKGRGRFGNDAYTKLLLDFEGVDGATTTTDKAVGGAAKTITFVGNAQLDTGITPKFGNSALLLDGSGDYVTVSDSADLDLGVSGQPFAVDCWVRLNSDTSYTIFSRGGGVLNWNTTNGIMYAIIASGGTFYFQWNEGGVNQQVSAVASLTDATWVHVAWTYDGTTMRGFIGGTSIGTPFASSGITKPTAANLTYIGEDVPAGSYPLAGSIDEFRISKGVARWTANFTPPDRPYF